MSTFTDLGEQGPHPEVVTHLVEQLAGGEVQILQQRTFYDVPWSQWSKDGTITKSGTLDVSAGIAISAPRDGPRQLIGYAATRQPGRERWGIAQTSTGPIANRRWQPLTGCFLSARGIWTGIGGLVHAPRFYSPKIGSVRITLADGQMFEGTVTDGSFLVLAPSDSAEVWSSWMNVEYYNTKGRKIRTDPYDLSGRP